MFVHLPAFADTAGNASNSLSGPATGGDGFGHGPGGNAYSGPTGPARGGSIQNFGEGGVTNTGGGSKSIHFTLAQYLYCMQTPLVLVASLDLVMSRAVMQGPVKINSTTRGPTTAKPQAETLTLVAVPTHRAGMSPTSLATTMPSATLEAVSQT